MTVTSDDGPGDRWAVPRDPATAASPMSSGMLEMAPRAAGGSSTPSVSSELHHLGKF
jgi:hypothetical protein